MMTFIEYLKTLSPADWNKMATPKWTVHDVVAHMVGWEKRDAEIIPIYWAKKKREPWMSTREEWDAFNRKEVEERKDHSSQQLIEEWEMWQKKAAEEVKKIGYDNMKARPDIFDWLFGGEDNKGGAYTLSEGGSHYEHHYEQIKQALNI